MKPQVNYPQNENTSRVCNITMKRETYDKIIEYVENHAELRRENVGHLNVPDFFCGAMLVLSAINVVPPPSWVFGIMRGVVGNLVISKGSCVIKKEKLERTFKAVAERKNLGDKTSTFVAFMKERWGDCEKEYCSKGGYAEEWADRFVYGTEYIKSDSIGQRILDSLAGKKSFCSVCKTRSYSDICEDCRTTMEVFHVASL